MQEACGTLQSPCGTWTKLHAASKPTTLGGELASSLDKALHVLWESQARRPFMQRWTVSTQDVQVLCRGE